MTGGTVVILGNVGDNFAAGMTGGMAFIYDEKNEFENFANPTSIIWQSIETDYWKKFLKERVEEFEFKTSSKKAKKILENFEAEIKNFKQVVLGRLEMISAENCTEFIITCQIKMYISTFIRFRKPF